MSENTEKRPPGVAVPWQERLDEIPEIRGDAEQVQRIWEETDALAYTYAWQCLLSF